MFSIHRSIIADRLEEVVGLTARCGAQEGVSQNGSFPFGLGFRVEGLGMDISPISGSFSEHGP